MKIILPFKIEAKLPIFSSHHFDFSVLRKKLSLLFLYKSLHIFLKSIYTLTKCRNQLESHKPKYLRHKLLSVQKPASLGHSEHRSPVKNGFWPR